ncbi:nhaD [Symbiodinium sp. CCMP2456]|nr:nhaD [Symbiodinium sp. CCMP2456]
MLSEQTSLDGLMHFPKTSGGRSNQVTQGFHTKTSHFAGMKVEPQAIELQAELLHGRAAKPDTRVHLSIGPRMCDPKRKSDDAEDGCRDRVWLDTRRLGGRLAAMWQKLGSDVQLCCRAAERFLEDMMFGHSYSAVHFPGR